MGFEHAGEGLALAGEAVVPAHAHADAHADVDIGISGRTFVKAPAHADAYAGAPAYADAHADMTSGGLGTRSFGFGISADAGGAFGESIVPGIGGAGLGAGSIMEVARQGAPDNREVGGEAMGVGGLALGGAPAGAGIGSIVPAVGTAVNTGAGAQVGAGVGAGVGGLVSAFWD